MKFQLHSCTALHATTVLLSMFTYPPSTLLAQGSLTPPGPPAPTMKSLDQIEARTAISSAPFTITQAGSYYLTTSVEVGSDNGITIATNGVTLDLNGFTISSSAPSANGVGILVSNDLQDITIFNGHVRGGVTNDVGIYSGSGFAYGVYSGDGSANVLVLRVSVSGCLDSGIRLSLTNSTAVESCTVRTAGGDGILAATVSRSSAADCGGIGIYGQQVSDCRGESSAVGVYAYTAQNCYGYSAAGVLVTTAQNCYGYGTSGAGVGAETAHNCYGHSAFIGVLATIALNCSGYGDSDSGVNAEIAQSCYGYSTTGTGVAAFVGHVCHGASSSGVALDATHNVDSF